MPNLNQTEPKNKIITDEDWNKLTKWFKINQKKLPLLKKMGRKLDHLVDRVDSSQGYIRPEMFVQEFIPDPTPVKDIIVNEDGYFTSYQGEFNNVQMHGIKEVDIVSINVNVAKFTAKVMCGHVSKCIDC